ncbi:glycine betaine ABC transporter substrate-binding protein [Candidatus Cetobacterium colombiensis]|jgi:osmoprotectant transport system permease protein|uniref:Glycine betaine ABC transporter substrate-binding protein n=1 Tax=Candidatus Cetobacterium colombiensis TaxID=3073100 RepID=A0ABU4W628_9FUSO|nr:glycine betaine ABC transporter substrate-binding protein [Candidatus Cetobacterium colombiensis]MDX8334977.1 glycine betaine ABC transporter substrate-binding protein [Candidatus Cetobacterium colombiensis]
MNSFIRYFIDKLPEVHIALMQHIEITGLAVAIAILIGVPIGIVIIKNEQLSKIVLTVAGVFQTIPSLALFGLIIPIMGIGVAPAVFVLFLYSLLPIITNTYIGIKGVDKSTIQAAVGMGMTNFQVLIKVKLPIAVAVIMGGIRISTVATIGTATIAALIGAGGLGELIFRGISTSNNNLVLTGAIPTAILAFVANYFLGVLEKVLTPTGMLAKPKEKKKNIKILKIAIVFLAVGIGYRSYENYKEKNTPTIIVGHKNYNEQRILGIMMSQVIEAYTPYKAKTVELGTGTVIFQALKSGDIDVYPEYTGVAYAAYLGKKEKADAKTVFDIIKDEYNENHNLDIRNPMGFENTYAFAMKPEVAEKYGIKNISDLKKYANNMILSGPHEFMEREDGLLGIQRAYNIKFKSILSMDQGLVINSLVSDKIEVALVYSTDGLIAKHKLQLLEDDLKFFPPYEVVVTMRKGYENLKSNVIASLDSLVNSLNENEMQELNLLAIEGEKPIEKIINDFLINKGIIKE